MGDSTSGANGGDASEDSFVTFRRLIKPNTLCIMKCQSQRQQPLKAWGVITDADILRRLGLPSTR